jgi:hypothetical protein
MLLLEALKINKHVWITVYSNMIYSIHGDVNRSSHLSCKIFRCFDVTCIASIGLGTYNRPKW